MSCTSLINVILSLLGGYITVWDVGNFLLHPPSESDSEQNQDEDHESVKDETKKEAKVNQQAAACTLNK